MSTLGGQEYGHAPKRYFPAKGNELKFSRATLNNEEVTCTNCGWPLKVAVLSDTGSVLFAGTGRGDRRYAHQRCPSLSERRELRRQALVNA